jgi:hypothetical protein
MVNIPDRKDDSAEAFAVQQEAIRKQVRESLDKAIQAELDKIVDEGKG